MHLKNSSQLHCAHRGFLAAIWLIGLSATAVQPCKGCQIVASQSSAIVTVVEFPGQEIVRDESDIFAQNKSLAECVAIGRNQNPRIHAARLELNALAERIPQVRSLPDPMAEIMYMVFDTPVQTAAGTQDYGLAMSQKVPIRRKRETMAAMAQEDVCAAQARLTGIELDIISKIRESYYELAYLQDAIRITKEDRDRLEQIAEVVMQLYEVKRSVKQSDVLQVEIVRSQLDTTLAGFEQQLRSSQAKLARLMHVSPDTIIQAENRPDDPSLSLNIDRMFELAIQQRPELQEQLFRIRRNERAVTLATLERIPDPSFGFNWIGVGSNGISPVANGNDSLMFNIGFNLPVYRRRIDAGIREARNMAQANSFSYEAMKDEANEEVVDIMAQIKAQQETLALLRDEILPASTRTLDQLIEQYQVNEVDFPQMIEGWRMVLQYQISEQRMRADLQQSLAKLAKAVGAYELSSLYPVSE